MRPKICLFFSLFLFYNETFSQTSYPIIPYPNKLVEAEGEFEFKGKLSSNFDIAFKSEMKTVGKIFEEEYFTRLVPSKNGNLVVRQNSFLGKEAYKLTVTKNKILVEASTGTGCFYAFQTIRQLMKLTVNGSYKVSYCTIEDSPAYPWRAFMLDEARNFKGMKVVKDILDQMALLKMNIFHWHLTDDQGWRIEIKKYPLLTEVGAWRDSTRLRQMVWRNDRWHWDDSGVYSNQSHGGFYTQEDIRNIVAYAAKRHISIVPEIEMPGHAMAAIAAYPWLVSSGEKIKVPSSLGIKKLAYNVANEKVYTFLEDVLTEVMNLFPGKIIHIGGDEVKYDTWKNNSDVEKLMKKQGLKTYPDVQIYFTNRIASFIQKKGFRMMGWNEIMGNVHVEEGEKVAESQLAKSSIIHFWKGDSLLVAEALAKGYDVVNARSVYTYLDFPGKRTPIKTAYQFSPAPKGLTAEQSKHVLGLGCHMWGETSPTVKLMQGFTFPRIAAYAEVGWTKEANKDFERFSKVLSNLKLYWDRKGIYYLEE